MVYRAHYEFKTEDTPPGEAMSGTIQYLSDTPAKAADDFRRWWRKRHEAAPEHFKRILAVNIYEVILQRIDDTGYLPQNIGARAYEWKCDFPMADAFWQE